MKTRVYLIIVFCLFCLFCSNTYARGIDEVIESTTHSIKQIETYEFNLVKREWVNNRDTGYQYMSVKVQVEPLKIYIKFVKPRGREALFLDGTLIVRRGGSMLSDLVLMIDPLSPVAMDDNRYPIMHMNPQTLSAQLVEHIRNELQFDPIIQCRKNAKYRGQVGTHYKLIHESKVEDMKCKTAEMLISDKHNVPIYFKVVNWADIVIEEYAFSEIKINEGFDEDTFDRDNPEYGLKSKVEGTK